MSSLAFVLALGLLGSCGGSTRESSGQDDAETAAAGDERDVDQIRALPYLAFSSDRAEDGAVGVVAFDRDRAESGYRLYSNRGLCNARLIDPRGRVVRAWGDARSRHWSNVELLTDGDLLVLGSQPGALPLTAPQHYVMRLAWDGEERWRRTIGAHHDAEITPDGMIAVLTQQFRTVPDLRSGVELKDNGITILTPDGDLVETVSLYDLLHTAPERFSLQEVAESDYWRRRIVDLLHANSLETMHRDDLASRSPIYAPGNVLVSFRHQDAVVIFDLRAREVVWAWGQGELSGPHDATVLDNGNILVFDNGLSRGWSRVIELDPLTREIVWQYRAPEPSSDFYTESRGASQRLPNGNTLIAHSDRGEAFEVTRNGDVVWRFLNPDLDAEGRHATLVRIKRYPRELVEGLPRQPASRTRLASCGDR